MRIPNKDTDIKKSRRRSERCLSKDKKRIVILAGTRPEVIKMAPVVREMKNRPKCFEFLLCSTGQHKEMLAQAMNDFGLKPDADLNVMSANQSLADLSATLYKEISRFLQDCKPDAILLQGDTTSVQVAALCAFYACIPVGHIEAGLRTWDISTPFPEELNRRIVGLVSRWHFAPTELSRQNLIEDKVDPRHIFVTGNTVIDALHWMQEVVRRDPPALPPRVEQAIAEKRPVILVTGHRRENLGQGIRNLCAALTGIAQSLPEARIVYPVHLNPNVQAPVMELLSGVDNIFLESPLSYKPMVRLMSEAKLIVSDSGGIQEEGPGLGKPVLITRESTERPEAVTAGVNKLVGTDPERIISETVRLMTNETAYASMLSSVCPFGDGNAAKKITDVLYNCFLPGDMQCS